MFSNVFRTLCCAAAVLCVATGLIFGAEEPDSDEPRRARDVETLGEQVTQERVSTREQVSSAVSTRVSTRTPGPIGSLTRKAGVEYRVTGVQYEERPWWRRDWFEVRMSGEGSFARSLSPSNRFSAHRGAGYRLTPSFEITPPEPLLRYESGPWSFQGGASLSAFYSDNLFLEEDDAESDIVKLGRPRVGLRWTRSNLSAGVQYSSSFRHSRFENMRFDNHQVAFTSNFRIRESLSGVVRNVSGWRTVLPAGEGEDAPRFFDNATVVGLGYQPWEDWRVDLGYDRYTARFNDSEEDDTTVNGFEVTANRRVAPAIWGFGHFRYEVTENTDLRPLGNAVNTDNDTYYASLGARFDPLTPIVGVFHAGWTQKVFDDDRLDDEGTIFIDGRLSYAPRDWLRFYWTASRRLFETSVVSLNAPDGPVYTRTSTSAGATVDVAERWGVGAKAFYVLDEYTGPTDRDDDLYGGRLSLHYRLNTWATAVVSYQYQQNDSSVDGEGFTENFVSGGFDFSF
mgnify:CR=1 FL=1